MANNHNKWHWLKVKEFLRNRKEKPKPPKIKVFRHQRTEHPGYKGGNWEIFCNCLLNICVLFGGGYLVVKVIEVFFTIHHQNYV